MTKKYWISDSNFANPFFLIGTIISFLSLPVPIVNLLISLGFWYVIRKSNPKMKIKAYSHWSIYLTTLLVVISGVITFFTVVPFVIFITFS